MGASKHNRPLRKMTAKGLRTRNELLQCAREAFEEYGYFATSVSEVGRRCGVSQGTFYQYFSNKEQIFRELVDAVLAEFWQQVHARANPAADFRQRLLAGLAVLFQHCAQHQAIHRILNEFELIDIITIGYFESIARYFRDFFRQAANGGHIRHLDPNVVSYSLIGMAIFHNMDWGPDAPEYSRDELCQMTMELILGGIAAPSAWEAPAHLADSAYPDPLGTPFQWEEGDTPGNRTRAAIFQAAEQVIGQFGYHGASISEITKRAGVAQGTFYIHFPSKQDLMQGVVRYLSRELRRNLRQATDRVDDRRLKEQEGIVAFFRFLEHHSQIYRVVAECETIGRETGLWYYRKLAAGYQDTLGMGIENKQLRPLPPAFLARSLMGLNHMIGLKWLVWNSAPGASVPKQTIEDTIYLVLYGLDPDA